MLSYVARLVVLSPNACAPCEATFGENTCGSRQYNTVMATGRRRKQQHDSCGKRMRAVEAAFADKGAAIDDIDAASGGTADSRHRLGLNDVGIRVWADNYAQYITQENARESSLGGRHHLTAPSDTLL